MKTATIIYLEEGAKVQLKIIAARNGVSMAELIRQVLDRYLKRHGYPDLKGKYLGDAVNPPRGRKPAQGKRAHAKAAKTAAGKARKAVQV